MGIYVINYKYVYFVVYVAAPFNGRCEIVLDGKIDCIKDIFDMERVIEKEKDTFNVFVTSYVLLRIEKTWNAPQWILKLLNR